MDDVTSLVQDLLKSWKEILGSGDMVERAGYRRYMSPCGERAMRHTLTLMALAEAVRGGGCKDEGRSSAA